MRKEEGRAFRYTPALSQAEMRSAFVANVLESVFAGDLDEFKAAVKASKSGKKE